MRAKTRGVRGKSKSFRAASRTVRKARREKRQIGARSRALRVSARASSSTTYRDTKSGRFVSESTWKRSKARGGVRYVRLSRKSHRRNRREINILGFDGYVPVAVHSSKPAKLASRHLIAVGRFLRTGEGELLKPFVGKRVGGVELLTDSDRLRILAEADLVKLDALYRNNPVAGRKK
jgi:hypothetical protein